MRATKLILLLGLLAALAMSAVADGAAPKKTLPTPVCKIYGMSYDQDSGVYTANGKCTYLKRVKGHVIRVAIRDPKWSYSALHVYDRGGGICPATSHGPTNSFSFEVPGNSYTMSVAFSLWATKTTAHRAGAKVTRTFADARGSQNAITQCSLG